MVDNITGITNGSKSSDTILFRPVTANVNVIIIQVLVGIFLYINSLMILTFFMKEAFRTDTRYILFVHMLFVDSFLMMATNLTLLLLYYRLVIPYEACIVLNLVMIWLQFCTPLTLVAMCLERYVAVCKPLRHAAISTPRIRVVGLLLIWGLGCVPALVILLSFAALVSAERLTMRVLCSVDALIVIEWQRYLQIAVFKFYFLVMSVVIAFTYIKVAAAARSASGENRKSSTKGTRTVALHAIQLLLCLMQLLTPFVEMAALQISVVVYNQIRVVNFVVFMIAPRCLSPLIYGLRDQKFFQTLRNYAVFGLDKKIQPAASQSRKVKLRH
ncbi:odorant receptor 131-2-like [Brienomyrus brachyistius]|uniref:odorant receptor 131-2-like n=1 Tax=Brienomyrus brachyistius TaxID=42636 RepID=UPI0020B1BF55|nr:odorant receptor 131-2-like [Brienomyrus brachyistius]XP_048860810.1 odorant receptor 131-2-like [Brienomyrus brachyistius]